MSSPVWPQHPALSQTVPVLYWAWWDAHRNPAATVRSAVEFHQRDLPAFQDRLDGLLVDKAAAGKCRPGGTRTPLTPTRSGSVPSPSQRPPTRTNAVRTPRRATARDFRGGSSLTWRRARSRCP